MGLGILSCMHHLCESLCPESSQFCSFSQTPLSPLETARCNEPSYPTGHDIYSTIKKSQQNGKIPRFRRVRGGGELYTSDTVMQSEYRGHAGGVGPVTLPLQATLQVGLCQPPSAGPKYTAQCGGEHPPLLPGHLFASMAKQLPNSCQVSASCSG